MRRRLCRVPVTVVYAALLVVVTVTLGALGPAVHDRVVGYASTNLHNLGAGRIDTLFASALIADDGRFFLWLPGLICLLAVAELAWRSRRLLAVFLVGHMERRSSSRRGWWPPSSWGGCRGRSAGLPMSGSATGC
ncbi:MULTISPECIES: rhomboid-like protein [Mycolicibacterium]|uniref:rhomboid-like protein n=1 Tax=Mycolicibacterium TaxID=1866885 RepID=UPI000B1AF2FE|nr:MULTISPECIES: rhomboid-like protein [Mycolicibacterium]MCX8553507.1 hypothetical protein [Mycolicibacterium mucogenicum]GCA96402.1 hypothetical protein NCCNTM_00370 [Mycolicibacterium sp. NCC-Tsukiji]